MTCPANSDRSELEFSIMILWPGAGDFMKTLKFTGSGLPMVVRFQC